MKKETESALCHDICRLITLLVREYLFHGMGEPSKVGKPVWKIRQEK